MALDQRRLLRVRAELLDYIDGDSTIWERRPLERLASEGQLSAFVHKGFWHPMDNCATRSSSTSSGPRARRPGRYGSDDAKRPPRERTGIVQELVNRSFWATRPVPITGVTGLVGASLLRLLVEAGADVVASCATGSRRARWSARASSTRSASSAATSRSGAPRAHPRRVRDRRPSSTSRRRPSSASRTATRSSTFESNIKGTWALLEACRRSPVGQRSSSPRATRPTATREVCPTTRRRRSSAGTRTTSASRAPTSSRTATRTRTACRSSITRCGNFYGGGDLNWNRIVPGTIRSVVRGERPVIRSDGKFVRDYFYVEEGARVYMMLAEKLAARRGAQGRGVQLLERDAGHGPRARRTRSSPR